MEMRIWLNLRLAMSLLTLASLLRRYRKVAQVRGADGPSLNSVAQRAGRGFLAACFGALRQ
jgi:hypothetical protein